MKKIEITIKNEISKKVRDEEEDGNKREQNHSIAQHAEKEKGNIYTYNVYYSYLYFFSLNMDTVLTIIILSNYISVDGAY